MPEPTIGQIAPKTYNLGDKVKYIGLDINLKTQYAGTLEIWQIAQDDIYSYACLKPNGGVSSWLRAEEIAPHDNDLQSSSKQQNRLMSIGDRVEIISTGQQGKLCQWFSDRRSATIELEDTSITNWISTSNLKSLENPIPNFYG